MSSLCLSVLLIVGIVFVGVVLVCVVLVGNLIVCVVLVGNLIVGNPAVLRRQVHSAIRP